MSIGRPDYNVKIVPVAEVIGDDEEQYTYFNIYNVAAGAVVYLFNTVVPSTYDLYLTLIAVSAQNPVSNDSGIMINYVQHFATKFITSYVLHGQGAAAIYVPAGSRIQIDIRNNYDLTSEVYVSLRGYKKLL